MSVPIKQNPRINSGSINATELFHKDGRSAGAWYCGKCRLSFSHREPAEQCCLPHPCVVCGKPCEKMFYTICNSCKSAQEIAREHERYTKAVKLTEWGGWVYVEGMGFQDGFFQDTEDLDDYCLGEGEELPPYAWTCTSKRLILLDIDVILEGILDDIQGSSSADRVGLYGLAEIRKAIEVFNEANKHLLTYDPDFTTCVLLKQDEPKQ